MPYTEGDNSIGRGFHSHTFCLNLLKFLDLCENLASQNWSIIWDVDAWFGLSMALLSHTQCPFLMYSKQIATDEVSSQPFLRKPNTHYPPLSRMSMVTLQTRTPEIHARSHEQLSTLEEECEGCGSGGEHHRRGVGVSGSLDERGGRRRA